MNGLKLPTVDELFGGAEKMDGVAELLINELHPFENHPFEVPSSEEPRMVELIESIKSRGILNPLLVRERVNAGGYEIISGHCRWTAAKLAGLETVPCLVRNYDNDESTIIMVDANLQREYISPWEKGWAYRLKADAMNHRGEKAGNGIINTRDKIGEEMGESGRQVARYIRLSYLIPQYKPYINSKKVSLAVAVSLSYLSDDLQDYVLSYISQGDIPTPLLAEQMKERHSQRKLTDQVVRMMFLNQHNAPVKRAISIKEKKLAKYFPPSMDKEEITGIIERLLSEWTAENHPELLSGESEGK